MQKKLVDYTNEVLDYIQNVPLSDSTVKYYRSCYKTLISYCKTNGCEFSEETTDNFLKYEEHRYLQNEIGKIYYLLMRKATYTLLEYWSKGTITWKRRCYNPITMCECYTNVLNDFKQWLSSNYLSTGSINLIIQVITKFLIFLENKKIYNISKIKIDHVKNFVIELAPRYKANRINLTWPLKKFFTFLNIMGYSNLNVSNILANPIPKRKKVLPCFTKEELNDLISNIDTSTSLGKRDYAIMKLAIGTGLRSIDIVNLCFSKIDWRANELRLTQHKTCKQLILPLTADVGNAIADYILNGRPESNSSFIFLKNRRPYEKLSRIVGANTIKRILENTGIIHIAGDGKSFHALRRTFGTELIKSKTPLPTVSQLLGHSSIDTSKRYISLNDDMLQFCCMDISNYATTKEGLR